jgi:hypothetical protein
MSGTPSVGGGNPVGGHARGPGGNQPRGNGRRFRRLPAPARNQIEDREQRLLRDIMKTPNGENPLVHGAKPILGCDVWEHSYYIDYRNRRPDYLKAFLDHLVNWDYVAERYEAAIR